MSAETFLYDVFLSHSAKDKAVVRAVAGRLRNDGVKVWFDEWVLKSGENVPSKIEEGLERSCVLVLCMSANASGSNGGQLEFGTFRFRDSLNKQRRSLPRRFEYAPSKMPRRNSFTSDGFRQTTIRRARSEEALTPKLDSTHPWVSPQFGQKPGLASLASVSSTASISEKC